MLHRLVETGQFFASHPLTRDRPGAAWRRFLGWQLRSRLQDEVAFDWIKGQKLLVRRGMTGATGNIYAGLHEFYDMALMLHLLRPGDIMFDIGANIGSYTILAAGCCGARVWAFEPDPGTAASLRRNVAINGLDEQVEVLPMAVGASDGEIGFSVGLDTMNKVSDAPGGQRVPVRRLDGLDLPPPTAIKIDVEGYEEEAFAGFGSILDQSRLKLVLTESDAPGVMTALTRAGFARASYDPHLRRLNAQSGASNNFLFVRDLDFVSERVRTAAPVQILGQAI